MSIGNVVLLRIAVLGAFLVLGIFCVFRSGRSSIEDGPSLLAEAIQLECQAESLLAEHGDILDQHDASTPLDRSEVGFGRGRLAARIALGEGRGVQRLLEDGSNEGLARTHLNRGKNAYAFALGIVEEAKIQSTR